MQTAQVAPSVELSCTSRSSVFRTDVEMMASARFAWLHSRRSSRSLAWMYLTANEELFLVAVLIIWVPHYSSCYYLNLWT